MLEYFTSGESHGKCITVVISDFPAGLPFDVDFLNQELARRQQGYGRGGRMKIEKDSVEVVSGVRNNETTGSPITLLINNRDYENWKNKIVEQFTKPRPGHADLVGGIKYRRSDLRDILERSSARETAGRVAVGALAKLLLKEFSISIVSHVINIGGIEIRKKFTDIDELLILKKNSELNCIDETAEKQIKKLIDETKEKGDTLGGIFQVIANNVPPALGSFNNYFNKLDAKIGMAFLSLQAIKGVEFGLGFEYANTLGSKAHDELFYDKNKPFNFYRNTNNAGGIEGGMSNGELIIVNAVMKPIPTLMKPLKSVDIKTKEQFLAVKERSDVCAVPACSIVGESLLAIEITKALGERFGSDNVFQMKTNFENEKYDFDWV